MGGNRHQTRELGMFCDSVRKEHPRHPAGRVPRCLPNEAAVPDALGTDKGFGLLPLKCDSAPPPSTLPNLNK
jgi:hypothetical protein